jgi:hypothetical protein
MRKPDYCIKMPSRIMPGDCDHRYSSIVSSGTERRGLLGDGLIILSLAFLSEKRCINFTHEDASLLNCRSRYQSIANLAIIKARMTYRQREVIEALGWHPLKKPFFSARSSPEPMSVLNVLSSRMNRNIPVFVAFAASLGTFFSADFNRSPRFAPPVFWQNSLSTISPNFDFTMKPY